MNKGDIGYLKDLKKRDLIKCSLQWGLVILLLIIGIIIFGTKLNILTIVAVLGCLPASKAMVAVVVKWPLKPVAEDIVLQVEEHATHMTKSYDVILTSKEKIMPLDCMVFSNNTIYGFTTNEKVGPEETGNYIKNFLYQNDCGKVNVKIFREFVPFISRVEGLNNIAAVEQADTKEIEENLKYIVKLYSM